MEPATRERIIELLQCSPNLTAAEMSRTLRVTRHDIRYHLKSLLAQGLVNKMPAAARITAPSAGRPAMVYQLSTSARPDITARLAGVLLEMGQKSSTSNTFLDELSSRILPFIPAETPQDHLSQRLNTCIQIINQHPYQARWEAHSAGPQVSFGNCPFSPIIADHPELCHMDRRIIENLTGLRAEQTRKIDFVGASSSVCIFKLTQVILSDK